MNMTAGETDTKVRRLHQPRWAASLHRMGTWRYKVLYGGRGSGKTYAVATALVVLAHQHSLRVVCVREKQNSIDESAKNELENQIQRLGLSRYYKITNQNIDHRENGSHFFFRGLSTVQEEAIRGWSGVDICWIEEAHDMSPSSWEILRPTIRGNPPWGDSEIWLTFNPKNRYDPAYKTFVAQGRDLSLIHI